MRYLSPSRYLYSKLSAYPAEASAQTDARIKKRLEELSYLERISAPIRRGKRFFFSRQHADKEKVVWYWRQGPRGEPRILIDPNTLSKDGSVALRGVSISWDGRRMAYKLSQNAADDATLYVMEVGSGEVSKTIYMQEGRVVFVIEEVEHVVGGEADRPLGPGERSPSPGPRGIGEGRG